MPELLTSNDGSSTLRLPTGETYHSIHGAVQESRHVFIVAGLLHCLQPPPPAQLRVLEIGLGTGLNVLLTAQVAEQTPQTHFEMVSLEPHPVPAGLASQLNYPSLLGGPTGDWLARIHTGAWGSPLWLAPNFTLAKQRTTLANYEGPVGHYDLVYHDAFAPRSQPELWGQAAFARLGQWLRPGGVLVTYCAKGQVRRNLRAAGFVTERLPGPPGKTEMTRAVYQPAGGGQGEANG
jgi:tRNA U34 5-methylaminomethyl-2-thiouridine-forming methyltransferase MnmC